jgi:CRP-like cAMP-binding protein
MAMFADQRQLVAAKSCGPCELLALSRNDFEECLKDFPDVGIDFRKQVAARMKSIRRVALFNARAIPEPEVDI